MKHPLVILFAIFTSTLSAQGNDKLYATTCRDSIFTDKICTDCADDYCFGGALFLERYLDSKLYLLLKRERITTKDLTIAITIDTLGIAKSVNFVDKDEFCISCNEIIFDAIYHLKRWKPDCTFSFDISENRMICREKNLFLYVKIIDSNIYINGKRERPKIFNK
jgi:hypothetical protein